MPLKVSYLCEKCNRIIRTGSRNVLCPSCCNKTITTEEKTKEVLKGLEFLTLSDKDSLAQIVETLVEFRFKPTSMSSIVLQRFASTFRDKVRGNVELNVNPVCDDPL
jgi:DNA-directed RNA polymerase subunit RPC12/RpoP